MKKFEFTGETIENYGRTLKQIRAKISFGIVKAGDIGGYIEKEGNLSDDGNAWVGGDARVYGNARVCGDAWVNGCARVYGDARVYGNAQVYGGAWVSGDAKVFDDAQVYGIAWVFGDAQVYGNAHVCGNAWVSGDARVYRTVHHVVVGPCGSRNDFTTFFRCGDAKIRVQCGCFYGDLDQFVNKVKITHGDTKHARAYCAAIEMAKAQIEDVQQN